MWEHGIKFLMPVIVRTFLELSLHRNQILNFVKLIDVDDIADSQVEARLKDSWQLKAKTTFKSWFFNLIRQP